MSTMPRDDERAKAQQLLLTALASTSSVGMTEGALRRMTDLTQSLFQEAMQGLTGTSQVVVSQGDGHKNHTEYHLVEQQRQVLREGPLSTLAVTVLARLQYRAEGARAISKTLEVDLGHVQSALDELEASGEVSRSQVGMLVIYRATSSI